MKHFQFQGKRISVSGKTGWKRTVCKRECPFSD